MAAILQMTFSNAFLHWWIHSPNKRASDTESLAMSQCHHELTNWDDLYRIYYFTLKKKSFFFLHLNCNVYGSIVSKLNFGGLDYVVEYQEA